MATQHNFRIKNGLEVAGTERISSAGAITPQSLTVTADASVGGNLTITGNLVVNGSTTTIDTATLSVEDLNITVASGAGNSSAADGAGLTIAGASAIFAWDHAQGAMTLNKELRLDNNKGLFFRNSSSNGTLGLKADTSDNITFRQNGQWDRLVIKDDGVDIAGHIYTPNSISSGFASTLKGYFYESTVDQNGTGKPSSVLGLAANINSRGEGPSIDFNAIWTGAAGYQQDNWNEGWTVGRVAGVYDSSGLDTGALAFYTQTSGSSGGASSSSLTEKMRITSAGNVGIGETSPSAKLHVKSAGTGNVFYVESSDGHHLGGFYQESDTRAAFNVRDASGNVKVNLDAGGDSWFTGGQVGIGTNNPTLPFEAHGPNNNTFAGSSLGTPGTILVQGTDGSGSGYAGGGIFLAGDYHTNGSTTTFAAIAGIKENTTNGEYAGALTFGTREGGTGAGNFERMRISSVGNVSVGTSAAFGQTTNRTCFTINGTSSVSLNIGVGNAQKGYLFTDGNMTQLGSVGSIPLKFAPNDSPKLELSVSGELSVYGNKMVIDSDYGAWNGRYQHLTCHNTITSSNTWTDVAYVSYSPSLTIQGMAQRDNSGAYGASNFLGTIFGGYGSTSVQAERSLASPMNGAGFGALEYRYLNSGASSGNYRLQVRISISAGTMYVTTTLTGHAWQEIYED